MGLDPRPVPDSVFGIDHAELRYARFDRSEVEAPRVLEAHEVAIRPGIFLEGPLGGTLRDVADLMPSVEALVQVSSGDLVEASLVLPDPWLRLVVSDAGDVPKRGAARDEALQWKLRRLVPFRVDELRVRELNLPPVKAGGERRIALAFAIDRLVSQLEAAFERAGVHIGNVVSESMACTRLLDARTLAAPHRADPEAVRVLVVACPEGYTIQLDQIAPPGSAEPAPLLYRHKSIKEGVGLDVLEQTIRRELALTLDFLERHRAGMRVREAWVQAPGSSAAVWASWLSDAAEVSALPVMDWSVSESFSFAEQGLLAPLAGSALEEVR